MKAPGQVLQCNNGTVAAEAGIAAGSVPSSRHGEETRTKLSPQSGRLCPANGSDGTRTRVRHRIQIRL
jgi:hypothetical protein